MLRPFVSSCMSLLVGLLVVGCYAGGEREKEAPPGYPGGFCLQAATCYKPDWRCNTEGLYCYDINDPCEGIYCGGEGECYVDPESSLPACLCGPGHSNEMYSLFCTPVSP
ncbi:MAG: hypothetical protein IPK80_31035 [Nannocystis sp.]|nr:hypothetical protein [Nannocystis sp.]